MRLWGRYIHTSLPPIACFYSAPLVRSVSSAMAMGVDEVIVAQLVLHIPQPGV